MGFPWCHGGRGWARTTEGSYIVKRLISVRPSDIDKFKLAGGGTEDHGRPHATMYMFTKLFRQKSRFFAVMYGGCHLADRSRAIDRLIDIREDCPEISTSPFIAETWERVTFRYNIFVAEGIRYISS